MIKLPGQQKTKNRNFTSLLTQAILMLMAVIVALAIAAPPAATNGFRKELWAVTSALPTSGLSDGDIINVGSSTQFTFPTGSPLSLAGNNIAVRLPYVPPDNTLGIWVYVEIDGVEKVGMFIGWMAITWGSHYKLFTAERSSPAAPDIIITPGRFMYFSATNTKSAARQFPANTVIKIYRAGI